MVLQFLAIIVLQWVKLTKDDIPKATYRASKLKEGTTYEFRVAAQNKAGQGPFSDPSAPVVAKEPLGKF